LKLTDDQKTRIAQIRQNVEERREAVIKNEGLSQDRKETILLRLHRTETREIFSVLTPEQQKEVQTRVMEQRSAEQKEHQSKQAAPAPANAPPTPAAR
jgi:hypothetical protein